MAIVDQPCLCCGHDEAEHQSELGVCDEPGCACQGFLSAESFKSDREEVSELHLGEEED